MLETQAIAKAGTLPTKSVLTIGFNPILSRECMRAYCKWPMLLFAFFLSTNLLDPLLPFLLGLTLRCLIALSTLAQLFNPF